jgi:uncharacterized membrane protein YdbT with pleckstrin-like domain
LRYIDKNKKVRAGGESVILKTDIHLVIFTFSVILTVAGVVLQKYRGIFIPYSTLIIFGVIFLFFASDAVRYLSSEYGVTTKRVIARTGVLRRATVVEIALTQIETVKVDQSLIGNTSEALRIFNFLV